MAGYAPAELAKLLSRMWEDMMSKSLVFLMLARGDAPNQPGAAPQIWVEKFGRVPGGDVELGKHAVNSLQPDMKLVREPERVFGGGVDMYRADPMVDSLHPISFLQ